MATRVIAAFDVISGCLILLGLCLDCWHIAVGLAASRRREPGPNPSPILLVAPICYLLAGTMQLNRLARSQYAGMGGVWLIPIAVVSLIALHLYGLGFAGSGDARWFLKLHRSTGSGVSNTSIKDVFLINCPTGEIQLSATVSIRPGMTYPECARIEDSTVRKRLAKLRNGSFELSYSFTYQSHGGRASLVFQNGVISRVRISLESTLEQSSTDSNADPDDPYGCIAREKYHREVLRKLLGAPPYEYEWGTVTIAPPDGWTGLPNGDIYLTYHHAVAR